MPRVRVLFSLAWAVVVVAGGLLWVVFTPLAQAAPAETVCRVGEVVCWQAHRRASSGAQRRSRASSGAQNKSGEQPVAGFQVANRSDDSVNLAYGWFERGANQQPIGEVSLPVVLPDIWAAEGWFMLKPGTTQIFYPPGSNLDFYVRVEADGQVIVPPTQLGDTDFCVAAPSFNSREHVGTEWFVMAYEDRAGTSGQTCATAGGEWRTFYKVPVSTTLIID